VHLDSVIPTWDFNERHGVDLLASTAAVMSAVEEVTWREVPLFRVLMAARSLRGANVSLDLPVLEGMADAGFSILHRADEELVFGLVVPAALSGRPLPDAGDFTPSPGHLAIAGNFAYDGARLTTETRVRAGDERSRRRFHLYWLVVRPFSGLIRREWLRAVATRATRGYTLPPGR
jgi:hypothetical protein